MFNKRKNDEPTRLSEFLDNVYVRIFIFIWWMIALLVAFAVCFLGVFATEKHYVLAFISLIVFTLLLTPLIKKLADD
jgi:membrane protein implicated in regulation of membrane protease activity